MKFRVSHPQDRSKVKVELDGVDVTRCIQGVNVNLGVDDLPQVTLIAIAADGVEIDADLAEVQIIERAYQVRHPNKNLEETPIREFLAKYEGTDSAST